MDVLPAPKASEPPLDVCGLSVKIHLHEFKMSECLQDAHSHQGQNQVSVTKVYMRQQTAECFVSKHANIDLSVQGYMSGSVKCSATHTESNAQTHMQAGLYLEIRDKSCIQLTSRSMVFALCHSSLKSCLPKYPRQQHCISVTLSLQATCYRLHEESDVGSKIHAIVLHPSCLSRLRSK